MIEENSTYASAFTAMWYVEVLIAPLFKARVIGGVVLVANFFMHPMKMNRIFLEEVRWCEIGTAAKPSVTWLGAIIELEIAVVDMSDRCHRAMGMDNKASTCHKEGSAFVASHLICFSCREGT